MEVMAEEKHQVAKRVILRRVANLQVGLEMSLYYKSFSVNRD